MTVKRPYSLQIRQTGIQKNLSQEETLAYGGRFDNCVAQYQFELQKYVPAACGLTIKCSEMANQIIANEQS